MRVKVRYEPAEDGAGKFEVQQPILEVSTSMLCLFVGLFNRLFHLETASLQSEIIPVVC